MIGRSLIAVSALVFAVAAIAQDVNLETGPTDDVWCYVHAIDPAGDSFLRVWGDGVDPIHPCPPDFYHSFTYLKFDLTSAFDPGATYVVKSAVLVMTHQFDPGYTQQQGIDNPPLAYSLGDSWDEATWSFGNVGVTIPCPAEPCFGAGDLSNYVPTTDRFEIPIDLLGNGAQRFTDYFNASLQGSGSLNLALATLLPPDDQGSPVFYKFLSKEHGSGLGPVLRVTAAPAVTVSGTVALDSFLGNPADLRIDFEVRQAGTTNVLETHTVSLDAGSGYGFETGQTGTVDIAAKGPLWLRQVRASVSLPTGGPLDFSLIGGDADGNNAVQVRDLNLALLNFGRSGAGVDGDVNGDGRVTLQDLNLILLRFGLTGDP